MIDDVYPAHVFLHFLEIVAVRLVEFHFRRDIVEVAAEHIVAAGNLVSVSQEGIREMAPKEARNAGNEHAVLRH